MTDFIPSFATQQILPPWKSEQAYVWGMVFPIDIKLVSKYCDRFLNNIESHSWLHYTPVPQPRRGQRESDAIGVLLYSKRYDARTPNNSLIFNPERSWDRITYTELSVNIPVRLAGVDPGTNLEFQRYCWCQPLVLCNNSTVRSSLREIFGQDVLPAHFCETPAPSGSDVSDPDLEGRTVSVRIPGVDNFGRTSKEGWVDLVDLVFPSAVEVAQPSEGDVALTKLIGDLWKDNTVNGARCLPKSVEFVSLKQFRDADVYTRAIYQGLIGSKTEFGGNAESCFLKEGASYQFHLNDTTREILKFFLGVEGGIGDAPFVIPVDSTGYGVPSSAFNINGPLTFGLWDDQPVFS